MADACYVVDRNPYGFACGISRNGFRLLHLDVGTDRNEMMAEAIVECLNNPGPYQCLCWSLGQHITGDGCRLCNPQKAIEVAEMGHSEEKD